MIRILLAEDNPVNQTVARELLRKLGHKVDVVENGAKAVAAVEAGSYDIVLMDLHMPVMDGLEASRRITSGNSARPRIIAVTANAAPGTREECLRAGMDDYIVKPITSEILRAALKRWGPAEPEADACSEAPAQQDGSPMRVLAGHLERLIAETDLEFVRELIALFLDSGAQLLEEMVRAREGSDWPSLERAAHSLKGASNNLGVRDLAELSLSLERAAAEHRGTMQQIEAVKQRFRSTEHELQRFLQRAPDS